MDYMPPMYAAYWRERIEPTLVGLPRGAIDRLRVQWWDDLTASPEGMDQVSDWWHGR